jgi:hypothetical protein
MMAPAVLTLARCVLCALYAAVSAAGMESMKTQFEERARVMLERMTVLGTKQEEMLEAQGQLGNELALVGGKVSEVSDQVGFSNHAILMLCGALSEMAKRVGISNGRYVKELENLSRSVHSLPAGHMGGMAALGGGITAAANLVSAADAPAGATGCLGGWWCLAWIDGAASAKYDQATAAVGCLLYSWMYRCTATACTHVIDVMLCCPALCGLCSSAPCSRMTQPSSTMGSQAHQQEQQQEALRPPQCLPRPHQALAPTPPCMQSQRG